MKTISKVSPLSYAKLAGVIYGLIGLLIGVVLAIISLVAAKGGGTGWLAAIGSLVVAPLFYGAIGFVFGALAGWLYNLAARLVGGVQIELE